MLSTNELPVEWEEPYSTINTLIYMIIKPIFTAVSVSCQIPSGVFTPNFVAGSVVGRLVGYFAQFCGGSVSPAVYAAVGAAATIGAITHTLSGALIVFELTGQIHYIVPMFTSTVIAYAIGS